MLCNAVLSRKHKIADLKLDGALVVLAACESGLGRVAADGVLGLGRAFMQAGARALVLSLWRVDDAATRALMLAFHAELQAGASVSTALARAQVATARAIGPDPSLWGAFIVVGDGSMTLRPGPGA